MELRSLRPWMGTTLTAAALLLAAFGAGRSDTATMSAGDKARLKKLDSGPKTIDVSHYPQEQKTAYALFAKKCVKCHTLARPINSDYVLPAEWERYVKRMVFKPNSKITEADGKSIYRFLVYDASVRKDKGLREGLAKLTPEERKEAVGKIQAVNPSFKPEP